MAKTIVNDLTGKVFGKITVLEAIPKDPKKNRKYKCLCACGKEFETYAMHIVHNVASSCGCWKAKEFRERITKHNGSYTKTYKVWATMKRRCLNPTHPNWGNYGGRGITVCAEWESFENFYKDMGDAPDGLSLERINNSLGYCKENCRWATATEQARNKRTNRILECNNEVRTAAEWAEITGIRASLITARIDELGWSVEKALMTPPAIHCGKLNPEQIEKIISLRSSGLTFLEIGRIVGCTQSAAHKRYQRHSP